MWNIKAWTTLSSMGALADNSISAEIAPAMLAKLQQDGRNFATNSFVLLMFWALVSFNCLTPYKDQSFVEAVRIALTLVAIAASIAGLTLRHYFARYTVGMEVAYRRENGKWRWDR